MSCLSLGKNFPPAKKAWEGFTSKLQRKLHKIKPSNSIKKTTTRLNTTLAAVLNRSQSFPSLFLQRRTKRRVIVRSSTSTLRLRFHKHHNHQSHKQKFSPVYVDELFTTEPISVQEPTAAATGKVKEKPPESSTAAAGTVAETSKSSCDHRPESSAAVYVPARGNPEQAMVEEPQLQGVDERAEKFIAKFKEEMRLQRQRSFGEYQEMLARGS